MADRGFTEGLHYFEIIADAQTENELKVGVTKVADFDMNSSFSDHNFGWAFYGIG